MPVILLTKIDNNSKNNMNKLNLRKLQTLTYKKLINLLIPNNKLHKSKYGKPYLNNYFLSVSHSNTYVAIAISKKPIGIDIQITKHFKKINLPIFTKRELSYLKNNENDVINLWVLKESFLKFIGQGFNINPLNFSIIPDSKTGEIKIYFENINTILKKDIYFHLSLNENYHFAMCSSLTNKYSFIKIPFQNLFTESTLKTENKNNK